MSSDILTTLELAPKVRTQYERTRRCTRNHLAVLHLLRQLGMDLRIFPQSIVPIIVFYTNPRVASCACVRALSRAHW